MPLMMKQPTYRDHSVLCCCGNMIETVTTIGMAYLDINNEVYAAEKLGKLLTGDEAPLLDGRYVNMPYEYHIKDRKIEHIYNVLTDENQLNLFEETNL